MVSPNIEKTKKTTEAKVPPVIISSTAFSSVSSPFTIPNFTIEDEIIMMTTNYFAGCNPVQFRLVADTQVQYSGTGIPIFNSKLILDNNDKCTYFMKKTVAFDLSPLEQVGHNEILLKIADFGEVLYSY